MTPWILNFKPTPHSEYSVGILSIVENTLTVCSMHAWRKASFGGSTLESLYPRLKLASKAPEMLELLRDLRALDDPKNHNYISLAPLFRRAKVLFEACQSSGDQNILSSLEKSAQPRDNEHYGEAEGDFNG